MKEPPLPLDEEERLEALRSCNLLDTEPEQGSTFWFELPLPGARM